MGTDSSLIITLVAALATVALLWSAWSTWVGMSLPGTTIRGLAARVVVFTWSLGILIIAVRHLYT